jgi:hypothetical protein
VTRRGPTAESAMKDLLVVATEYAVIIIDAIALSLSCMQR